MCDAHALTHRDGWYPPVAERSAGYHSRRGWKVQCSTGFLRIKPSGTHDLEGITVTSMDAKSF